mgnify:CR=1 FL=1
MQVQISVLSYGTWYLVNSMASPPRVGELIEFNKQFTLSDGTVVRRARVDKIVYVMGQPTWWSRFWRKDPGIAYVRVLCSPWEPGDG